MISLENVRGLADRGGLVPVSRKILADTETPVSAYLKIRSKSPYAFLFESVEGGEKIGRYSFLGVGPFLIFRSRGAEIQVEDLEKDEKKTFEGDPISEFRKLLKRFRSVHVDGLPRFTGGAVGYVGYDAIRLIEDIPDQTMDDLELDDILFLFFDIGISIKNGKF